MVDVKFVRKFDNPVALDAIKAQSNLLEMQLVKRSRISVQRVRPQEWLTILSMAGVDM